MRILWLLFYGYSREVNREWYPEFNTHECWVVQCQQSKVTLGRLLPGDLAPRIHQRLSPPEKPNAQRWREVWRQVCQDLPHRQWDLILFHGHGRGFVLGEPFSRTRPTLTIQRLVDELEQAGHRCRTLFLESCYTLHLYSMVEAHRIAQYLVGSPEFMLWWTSMKTPAFWQPATSMRQWLQHLIEQCRVARPKKVPLFAVDLRHLPPLLQQLQELDWSQVVFTTQSILHRPDRVAKSDDANVHDMLTILAPISPLARLWQKLVIGAPVARSHGPSIFYRPYRRFTGMTRETTLHRLFPAFSHLYRLAHKPGDEQYKAWTF